MILSDEEAAARLESDGNLTKRLIEVRRLKEGGRKLGDVEVPMALKSLIGSLAVQGNESRGDIAEVFDISQASVSNYSRGMISSTRNIELEEKIAAAEEKVEEEKEITLAEAHKKALDVMVGSLGVLSDKIKEGVDIKPTQLSRIASDMSKIVQGGADANSGTINNVKVVVYAPQQRKEETYDFIEA